MPKAVLVKKGEEYLPGVPLAELEETHRREPPGKPRDRLQAAVLRKRGKMIVEIATISGRRWRGPLRRRTIRNKEFLDHPTGCRPACQLDHSSGSRGPDTFQSRASGSLNQLRKVYPLHHLSFVRSCRRGAIHKNKASSRLTHHDRTVRQRTAKRVV